MRFNKRMTFILIIIFSAAAIIFAVNHANRKRIFKESRNSLYTIVTITVATNSEELAKTAIDAAYQELDRLGKLLNFYADNSELSAVNQNAGNAPVIVSPDTLEIIKAAVFAGGQTNGGFDVTIGPVVKLWNFKDKTMPTKDQVTENLADVGFKNIVIDEAASTVFLKKAGVQIDLGGIIKGFAADKAVEILKRHGIEDGIVAVAGDIATFGTQLNGRPWHIGIQNPRQEGNDDALLATVDLRDKGISTSGDYQRFFIADGVRYHHLLNPKTGFPESLCRSVTIIAEKTALTDAFATGIFVMGPDEGMKVLERLGMDGIIVDSKGNVLLTEGIKDQVHLFDRPAKS
ncbi:FAD:protein FMN transferase [Desulfopila inferna]|uniref:FAD:protein FMN transferase n=1 Tax=Desulfopila inferna TaxID=468528 RepID=UPI00196388AD|nr:FAD:protein FMN transferase [Desulfopila inferna]MBM9605309.1 FAD:protein FMN transferase [Desulfopila inferna]